MNRPGPIIAFWLTLLAFGFIPTIVNLTLHCFIAWLCAWCSWAALETLGGHRDHHR